MQLSKWIPSNRIDNIDERVTRAAGRINELVEHSTLRLALAIGRAVIEELYDGEFERWRERGPKDYSLRKLAQSPELAISASALCRSLGIYELHERLGSELGWERLSVSQVRTVLGLPHAEQAQLLRQAIADSWTVARLQCIASERRARYKSSKGGRPRTPRFLRAVIRAEQAFSADELFADLDAFEHMDPDQQRDVERRLSFIRQRCLELASQLGVSNT